MSERIWGFVVKRAIQIDAYFTLLLLQATSRKSRMAYLIALFPMSLSDLAYCTFLQMCFFVQVLTVDKISTDK